MTCLQVGECKQMNDEMTNYIERYWRDATPQDAIKDPPMVARFRDEHYKDWVTD